MAFIFPSSEYLYLVITIACFCWRAKICYQPMCTTMQTTMLKYLCGKTERVDKYQLLLGVCLWFNIKKKSSTKNLRVCMIFIGAGLEGNDLCMMWRCVLGKALDMTLNVDWSHVIMKLASLLWRMEWSMVGASISRVKPIHTKI